MEKIYNENEHHYGNWQISNINGQDMAIRTCLNCNFTRILPLTKEILNDIKKQTNKIPPQKLASGFLKMKSDDINLIGSINLILEEAIITLSYEEQIPIINKLIELIQANTLTDENNILLTRIITAIKSHNYDQYNTDLISFQKYNEEEGNFEFKQESSPKKSY